MFDLFLRMFLLKRKKIPTQGRTWTSNPDHSYANLSLSHTTTPKRHNSERFKYKHKQTVFLNYYINDKRP